MKILKSITVQLVPDATGVAYSNAQVSYVVGTSDDSSINTGRVLTCPLSVPDQTNAQTVFNDVLAFVKQTEGIS